MFWLLLFYYNIKIISSNYSGNYGKSLALKINFFRFDIVEDFIVFSEFSINNFVIKGIDINDINIMWFWVVNILIEIRDVFD